MYADKHGHLPYIVIEVTRKCNFTCGHCLRGNAQNADLDLNKLRQFFRENSDIKHIGTFTPGGGESLLKPEIIKEMVDVFREFDIEVQGYYIPTNGSCFTPEAIDAVCKLHWYCSDNDVSCVEVSNSVWHTKDQNFVPFFGREEILNDLMDYDEERQEYSLPSCMEWTGELNNITICHRSELGYHSNIVSEGRAKHFGSSQLEEHKRWGTDPDENENMLYITVNGDIIEGYCDASYETQEQLIKENS